MKKKLFNVVAFTMLGVSMVSMAYVIMPEFQEVLPDLGIVNATVAAIGSFLTGGGYVLMTTFINKKQKQFNESTQIMADKFIEITNDYKAMKESADANSTKIDELIKLTKIELNTKLSNPMTTDTVRELIEGALYGKEE